MIFALLTTSWFLLVFILCPSLCILQTFSDVCAGPRARGSGPCWKPLIYTVNYQNTPSFPKAPFVEGRCAPGVKLSKVEMWPAAGIDQNEAWRLWLWTRNRDSWLPCPTAFSKSRILGTSNLTPLPHSLLETLCVCLAW